MSAARKRTSATTLALHGALVGELARQADPDRAKPMQAYMKSTIPFWGVGRPALKKLCRLVFAAHPLPDEPTYERTVLHLWRNGKKREERYAAIELSGARMYKAYQTPDRLDAYEELIVTGAWWDYVDEVAIHRIGPLLRTHPKPVTKLMKRWITDADLWRRRTSIIVQVASKERTDTALLSQAIEKNLGDKDFFIRKAIGWALRSYAYIDPDWVRDFVRRHESAMSGLSKREALKNIGA